ncbi:serine/threonine-protein kinase [Amnibacterium endophyticum]|uniref:non-specific serine/threonine protein kinase n=1 Tax=Amnibacterium endophyticum TaxID=2109337 RepID=A0ABW4LG37_9MICO
MSSSARPAFDVRLPSRYQVSRVIGRGGAAVVLQAKDLRLQREVAVKVFTQRAATPEVLLEQEREAQLLARSAHPNLVTIFDVSAERGEPGAEQRLFLVMEYVDGPDLAQWLRFQRASVRQVAELGAALSAALLFVHRAGVLHCDIKPSNVLLRIGPDGELVPKLADFGIAAVLQGRVQQGEFTVGTAAYLSPEQVEGGVLQEPSDVYALGLVLLETATGRIAFPGGVVESAFSRLDQDPVIPDDVPEPLAEVLRGMTHRDPAERWSLDRARTAFRSIERGGSTEAPDREPADDGDEDEQRPVTLPSLRTIGPDARMPALTRAVELAARATAAEASLLIVTEDGGPVLHAWHGLEREAAVALVAEHGLHGASCAADDEAVALAPVVDSRGERLGTLAVVRPARDGQQQRLLEDVAYLAGQVLELRSATRRALLSR